MFPQLSTEHTQEAKNVFFTFFYYHIFHPHQLQHLAKNDGRFIQLCVLFTRKNSLLRIGKHKRCSLSIYHTSFDPHQLHYSKATIEEERNIPRPYNQRAIYLGSFQEFFLFCANMQKYFRNAFLSGFLFETKIQIKCYSNGFQNQSFI